MVGLIHVCLFGFLERNFGADGRPLCKEHADTTLLSVAPELPEDCRVVLWGEQDVALTLDTLEGTDRYVSNLTLRRFPDASHWVQQDVPDRVNAEMQRWFMEHPLQKEGRDGH